MRKRKRAQGSDQDAFFCTHCSKTLAKRRHVLKYWDKLQGQWRVQIAAAAQEPVIGPTVPDTALTQTSAARMLFSRVRRMTMIWRNCSRIGGPVHMPQILTMTTTTNLQAIGCVCVPRVRGVVVSVRVWRWCACACLCVPRVRMRMSESLCWFNDHIDPVISPV